MKAARIHRYGGNEVVVIEEIAMPIAGLGEVLVKVHGAAVNPVDWKIREGYMSQMLPVEFPYTLGCDVSGTIVSLGAGVSSFTVGDAVFGYPNLMRCGAFAEAIVMQASELANAPQSIELAHAAALPVAVITAYDGLFTHGGLQAAQRVLILGGAGGVGSAAIQLAKWRGAEVFATASARNQNALRSLGANPIDYGSQATADLVRDVDLIFDCVGVESGIAALPSLKRGGTYVTTVYALPEPTMLAQYDARPVMFGIQPSGGRLAEIAAIVDQGGLKMAIDQVFSLDQTAEALAASQAGRTRGKILIRPESNR